VGSIGVGSGVRGERPARPDPPAGAFVARRGPDPLAAASRPAGEQRKEIDPFYAAGPTSLVTAPADFELASCSHTRCG
jgi:hypothetical protein